MKKTFKAIKANFQNLVLIIVLSSLTSCIIPYPYFSEPCTLKFKVDSLGLSQKPKPKPGAIYHYDSISYRFDIKHSHIVEGSFGCAVDEGTFVDSITDIQIITLRKYNSVYDSLDTITPNFKDVKYNSLPELFAVYNGKIPADYDFDLRLISPPSLKPYYVHPETGDTAYGHRTLQFKFIVKFLDNRTFELISQPIDAIP